MDAALSSEDTKLSCLGELGESGRELALRRMAIRQARLERLALSASDHERMVYGGAVASGEERSDFFRRNRPVR